MTEPPNTEVLLATVREALREYTARLRDPVPEKRALVALDAIASELARLTTERQEQVRLSGERAALLTRYSQRAETAEAELERVRAERDELLEQARADYRKLNQQQARLGRAVGSADALIGWLVAERPVVVREIPVPVMRELREAGAALAEIEESG